MERRNATPIARSTAPLAAALVCLAWPLAVRAEGSWSASLGATTDYVYRGVSQTEGRAAAQLGADYRSNDGWFLGAWGSNVDPYPGRAASQELDLYAGASRTLGSDFTLRGTFTHYAYLDDPRPTHYAHDELALGAGYLDLVAASVAYRPNGSAYPQRGAAHGRTTLAYELTARWPLRQGFALTGGAGYYDLSRQFGLWYWAAHTGLAYVRGHATLELDRFYCDATVARLYVDGSANGRWALSALWRL